MTYSHPSLSPPHILVTALLNRVEHSRAGCMHPIYTLLLATLDPYSGFLPSHIRVAVVSDVANCTFLADFDDGIARCTASEPTLLLDAAA